VIMKREEGRRNDHLCRSARSLFGFFSRRLEFVQNSLNKNVFLWYCQLIAVLLFLPLTVIELADLRMTGEVVVLFMLASALIHGDVYAFAG
jgi:hypothetical protein